MQNQLKQKEIAKFLSVSPAKVKELTKNGMPHVVLGVTPRYDPTEVLVWLKEVTQNIYTGRFLLELEKLKFDSCSCGCGISEPDKELHYNSCTYRKIQNLIDSL